MVGFTSYMKSKASDIKLELKSDFKEKDGKSETSTVVHKALVNYFTANNLPLPEYLGGISQTSRFKRQDSKLQIQPNSLSESGSSISSHQTSNSKLVDETDPYLKPRLHQNQQQHQQPIYNQQSRSSNQPTQTQNAQPVHSKYQTGSQWSEQRPLSNGSAHSNSRFGSRFSSTSMVSASSDTKTSLNSSSQRRKRFG
ncbi:hypothetical protein DAMA08_023110 [Martiniozyma asiatica (nom. inval.)]|nr:hypothetical protein DAMA08_023110 [Martiniozyma asiatica]